MDTVSDLELEITASVTICQFSKRIRREGVSTVYRQDFIAASSVLNGQAWTLIRPLGPAGLHLVRASEARTLSERFAGGEVATVPEKAAASDYAERTAGTAVVFPTPYWALLPSFCGFIARLVRDFIDGLGSNQNLATFVAAAAVVFIAVSFVRRPGVSPIVMLVGIIPLGAAGALFRAIVGFLHVSSLKGQGLSAPVALISNLSIVFTTTAAIGMGAWIGYLLGQSVRHDQLV